MFIGDLTMLFFFFFLIFFSIIVNVNTSLHLLLTAELLWISLYGITVFIGLSYDNFNLLSLTFFFLVLSAVEFGVGLVILLLQNIINRTINLNSNEINLSKFLLKLKNKLYLNKINWRK